MPQMMGKNTLKLTSSPSILSWASVASKKESEGPLAAFFDIICDDSAFGEQTWEKAESRMQKDAVNKALEKARLNPADINFAFAGDLLNQCIGSSFGMRGFDIPVIGLYGACSTMAEGLGLAGIFIEGGAGQRCIASTSSHFCSSERQFRFPLEYASQRTPSSQWTVTGAGAAIVGSGEQPPFIRSVCFGAIQDLGIKDANNMGAAMAPAAAKTIGQFFKDTITNDENYDLILTGDLGYVGSELLKTLIREDGYELTERNYNDCGLMIYDRKEQNVQSGGSGCGCSASVLCSYILPRIRNGSLHNVLFIATGALMSPTSLQQGESIPGVAHLIHLSDSPNG